MPQKGRLDELVARIDERTEEMDKKLDCLSLVILGNGKPEAGLAAKFTAHCEQPHMHRLVKSKAFWAIMFIVILAANTMLDYGSPAVAWVGRLLGVPIN